MERITSPPNWCQKLCSNAFSDVCIEDCATNRDCSRFSLKQIPLEKLPEYPIGEMKDMTKEEKFVSVAIYVAKLTEGLKEGKHGRDTDSSAGSRIFKD